MCCTVRGRGGGELCEFFEGYSANGSDAAMPDGIYSLDDLKEFGREKGCVCGVNCCYCREPYTVVFQGITRPRDNILDLITEAGIRSVRGGGVYFVPINNNNNYTYKKQLYIICSHGG